MDDAGVLNDDSLLEYIFGVDYVVADRDGTGTRLDDCGPSGTQSCVEFAMVEEFGATVVDDCADLNSSSTGIIYVPNPCGSLSQTIGTPDNPAIVVINQGSAELRLKQGTIFYGMLFVHSKDQDAQIDGTNPQVYGSLVVEGDIKMTGSFMIVYDDTSASSNTHPSRRARSSVAFRARGSTPRPRSEDARHEDTCSCSPPARFQPDRSADRGDRA